MVVGPAKSRLRWHLKLTRDNVEKYKKAKSLTQNDVYCNKLLDTAEFHLRIAVDIYNVVYVR